MKINECAVIDIELLKSQVAVLRKKCEIFKDLNDHHAVSSRMRVINTIESIIESSKPLEPIVRDAYRMGRIDIRGIFANKYINETEI